MLQTHHRLASTRKYSNIARCRCWCREKRDALLLPLLLFGWLYMTSPKKKMGWSHRRRTRAASKQRSVDIHKARRAANEWASRASVRNSFSRVSRRRVGPAIAPDGTRRELDEQKHALLKRASFKHSTRLWRAVLSISRRCSLSLGFFCFSLLQQRIRFFYKRWKLSIFVCVVQVHQVENQ